MKESDKQILKSAGPLLAIIVLLFAVGKFSLSQIKNLRNQITNAEKTQAVLADKLKVLRSISEMPASETNIALIAMPRTNPSLSVISQIKVLASESAVALENIKSTSLEEEGGGLSYATTSFKVFGSRAAILAFVEKIKIIAPITFVEKVDLSENFGISEANISTKTYFAPLPESIPTVTQAVSDLTSTEKEMLIQMLSLRAPMISDETFTASGSAINASPFGD